MNLLDIQYVATFFSVKNCLFAKCIIFNHQMGGLGKKKCLDPDREQKSFLGNKLWKVFFVYQAILFKCLKQIKLHT
mgnify:CR=1 FL=1